MTKEEEEVVKMIQWPVEYYGHAVRDTKGVPWTVIPVALNLALEQEQVLGSMIANSLNERYHK